MNTRLAENPSNIQVPNVSKMAWRIGSTFTTCAEPVWELGLVM